MAGTHLSKFKREGLEPHQVFREVGLNPSQALPRRVGAWQMHSLLKRGKLHLLKSLSQKKVKDGMSFP